MMDDLKQNKNILIFYTISSKLIEILLISLLIYLFKNNLLTIERFIKYLIIILN